MKLKDLGEFGLIKRISNQCELPPKHIVGIGDDTAIIPRENGISELITTDTLVEDIHFLRSKISAVDLGAKALSISLSDIAAMGGNPEWGFLSLSLPPTLELEWVDSFLEGFNSIAKNHQLILLGGDTTSTPGPIIIGVTVVGSAKNEHIKTRSSASPGDIVAVTASLGDAAAGLKLLLESKPIQDFDEKFLLDKQNRPIAQIKTGQTLALHGGIHAMMDISDGVASDLKRIAESSNCGFEINLDQLPFSQSLINVSNKYHWDKVQFALNGGEDYCLLVTYAPDYLQTQHLIPIGKVTNQPSVIQYFKDGQLVNIKANGYDHFAINAIDHIS